MANLNHIGIAVSDLPKMQELFSILGLSASHSEKVSTQGVMTHFLPLPVVQSNLELLEPLDKQAGAVAQFIQKRGPGIHHLSFAVERGELENLCVKLKTAGFRLIYDQPQPGAHGMRVNFVHPASAGGILIEVMEPG